MNQKVEIIHPFVSVVIPVFNGECFVIDAVESALNQAYNNLEVLVVDDGSSDGTWSVLQRYYNHAKVQLLIHEGHENRGVSKSRKLGAEVSKGKYISFLDADDVFLEGKVAHQVEILEGNQDVVLCHGGLLAVSDSIAPHNFVQHFALAEDNYKYDYKTEDYFLNKNRICNSTSMIRADVLKTVDFDIPQLFQYEDFLLWLLLSEKGKFFFTPRELITYRYHAESATARTVDNPLVAKFSKLEFYLSALSRVEDVDSREKLLKLLGEVLCSLANIYAEKGPSADIDGKSNISLRSLLLKVSRGFFRAE